MATTFRPVTLSRRCLAVLALLFLAGLAGMPARALMAAGLLSDGDKVRPVVIASDPWCPYACNPETEGREGYMVELAREVFREAGLSVEYRIVNFQVMRRMAADGSATLVPGVAADLDGVLVLPTLSQGNSANAVAVAPARDFAWAGPDSFAGHRLGVIKDYNYGGAIQAYVDQHKGNPGRVEVLSGFGYSHVTQGLRMVMAGRMDLFLDDRNVLAWTLSRLPKSDGIRVVSLQDEADLFVGVSRRDPRAATLAALLSDGTARLRASGRLAEILASYGLTDWEQPGR